MVGLRLAALREIGEEIVELAPAEGIGEGEPAEGEGSVQDDAPLSDQAWQG